MLMMLAGKRYYPIGADVRVLPFTVALLFSTFSILSIGFLIASIVPTARFAQPIGTVILYPMLGLSGLFVPVAALPPALQIVARVLPAIRAEVRKYLRPATPLLTRILHEGIGLAEDPATGESFGMSRSRLIAQAE